MEFYLKGFGIAYKLDGMRCKVFEGSYCKGSCQSHMEKAYAMGRIHGKAKKEMFKAMIEALGRLLKSKNSLISRRHLRLSLKELSISIMLSISH